MLQPMVSIKVELESAIVNRLILSEEEPLADLMEEELPKDYVKFNRGK